MKAEQIVVGGEYRASVSGKVTTVRVETINVNKGRTVGSMKIRGGTTYTCTNLATGRKIHVRSAAKFRSSAARPSLLANSKMYLCADCGVKIHISPKDFEPTQPILCQKCDPAFASLLDNKFHNATAKAETIRAQGGQYTPSQTTDCLPLSKVEEAPVNTHYKHALAAKLRERQEVTDAAPHLVVEARAGTGKTTTLIEGLKIVKGMESSLTPSPQQAAVWASMALSKGNVTTIGFVAFNVSIADELKARVPAGCEAMTMHSLGMRAVNRVYNLPRDSGVNKDRVQNIIEELTGRDIRELRRTSPELVKGTEQLVALCKQNLVQVDELAAAGLGSEMEAELDKLSGHYEVELNGHRTQVYNLVPRILTRCKDVAKDNCIDFNDMIWLPIVLNLTVQKFDLLLVDEAQDLNRCQQALALKAGRRLILCGDDRQAIYGFAGADADSLPRMKQILGEMERGCEALPLTVTRRCGKAIVRQAQQIVPDFEAFESNCEGAVLHMTIDKNNEIISEDGSTKKPFALVASDGDFILCRVNAPLVSQCFRFLRAERKAQIQGRDIGAGLISTLKRMKATNVPDLVGKLSDWLHQEQKKENAKRVPSEHRIIALQDRYDCLVCFTEGARTIEDVIVKIEKIFTDDKKAAGIRLSSIHKAKGLEAKRVYFLMPEGAGCPHPMAKSAWQRQQEWNLRYVGETRAIEELVYVRSA